MGRVYQQWFAIAVGVCVMLAGARWSESAEKADVELKRTMRDLERWLGSDPNAPGWRKFLKTEQLAAEIEKGAAADRLVVRKALERFASDQPGLDLRRFAAVRRALNAWFDTLPTLSADQLPKAAREAKPQFVVVAQSDVDRQRVSLAAAVERLSRLLKRSGEEDATRWKEAVKWDQLETQLAAKDVRPDLKTLQAISELYYQDISGLERDEFMGVRQALDKYVSMALFSSSADSKKFYENYLDTLAERLTAYAQDPKTEDAVVIGKMLGWMERFGQAGDLVEAARTAHSHPNLFLEVSEALMQAGIDQNVDESAAVNEVILGTRIRGNARLTGKVTLDLIPSEEDAVMDILLNGSTVSDSVGYNGPVRVFSRGFTSVAARKRLELDDAGLHDYRATARCSTRTRIGRVDAGRLVRHVAMKRINESKPEAEAIASWRVAGRIAASVDARAVDLVGDANAKFEDKFRTPLVRRGGFPQSLGFRTTDDALLVTMLQAGRYQLAAPNAPPALKGKFDLAVRMHESLAGNMSQAVLGGVTLTDERLVEIIKETTGKVPPELVITEEDDPWSITFDSEAPIDVRFHDKTVKIMIRGKRFTRSDQEIRKAVEIAAVYSLEKLADRARLVRQGDVQIEFAGRSKLSTSDIAMKTFMKKKFEGLFKPEIVSEGLALPERWKSLGKLKLDQLTCDKGWLALGWLKPPAPPAADETRVASLD